MHVRRKGVEIRISSQDGCEHVTRRLAAERARSGQHFVQHAPEREDVRTLVDDGAPCLLWRHVGGSAHHDACVRQPGTCRPVASICVLFRRRQNLRESEIENLHLAIRLQHDVGRLEIAMDDAPVVGGFESVRDVVSDAQRLGRGDRPITQALGQCPAGDQLHDDRARTSRRGLPRACRWKFFQSVDLRDVGMIQRSEDFRLTREPREAIGVAGELDGQDLQRNIAIETQIPRAIDVAHPA